MIRLPVFAVLLLSSASLLAGNGQYHVCTDDAGRKTFTSEPCGAGEAAEVRTYKSSPGKGKARVITTDNPVYQQMKADNRRAEVLRSIKTHNKNIETYSSRMSNELVVLKRKKLRANNNIAGAAWESSISEEMSAVTNKYTTLIGVERDRVNDLNAELSGL
jgi:IS1 family transposase